MSEGVITGVVVAVVAIIVIIVAICANKAIFNKYDKTVKATSSLYKNLIELNKKQKFNNDVSEKYDYATYLKSKRGLDNFVMSDYLMDVLYENEVFFGKLFAKLNDNSILWNIYENDYKKLAKYTTLDEIEKMNTELNLKIKPTKYNSHEIRIFEKYKLNHPVINTSVYCHASYTSPAGKKHYWKSNTFTHSQVFVMLQKIKATREEQERIKQEKIDRKNALVTKEQRLREKEREIKAKEKKLQNIERRERDLTLKEEEFIKATKDHIYSAEESNDDDVVNLSPYEQLKLLKRQLDDGEISFEEYHKKRKELTE